MIGLYITLQILVLYTLIGKAFQLFIKPYIILGKF